jgi:hypothetical protein
LQFVAGAAPARPVLSHVSAGTALDLVMCSRTETTFMVIKIAPNDKGNPAGKLADAELLFTEGELQGMKLMGFSVWERKNGPGRSVTFPARAYSVNGERRSYVLFRPDSDGHAQDRVRDLILRAYDDFQAQVAVAS